MNNKLYILPLAAVMAGTFASCNREQDLLWDQSAAQRIDNAVAEQFKVLTGATNGWSMYYFAPYADGGVNFVVKFDKNGSVVLGTRNSENATTYTEETSLWEIITDNGPVLTFNSYNNLLHYYADPDGAVNGGSQGIGLGGDYEFMIMSYCPDSVVLQGKKTDIECKLFPLAEGEFGAQYFDEIDAREASYFNGAFPYVWLEASNGERYTAICNPGINGIDFCIEGGDALFDTKSASYVVTNKGIKFYEPFAGENNDLEILEFVYDEASTKLVCINDGSYFTAGPLDKFFALKGQKWNIDLANSGGAIGEACKALADACAANSFTLNELGLTYNAAAKKYSFYFTIKRKRDTFNGNFYGDIKGENGEVAVAITDEKDANANVLIGQLPQLEGVYKALNAASPFTPESTSALNPSTMKLVSKANPANFATFNITK